MGQRGIICDSAADPINQCTYHWLDDLWYLVHKRDGSRDMVQDRYFSYLLHDRQLHHSRVEQSTYLPRTRDVLQELHYSVRDVLERSQVYTLVIPELPIRHVSMILDDLSNVLRGEILPYQLLFRKETIAI